MRRQLLYLALILPVFAGVGILLLTDLGALFGSQAPAGGVGAGPGDGGPQARHVVVQAVGTESDAAVIRAVGSGKSQRSVTLFPEASGRVVAVLFEAGDRVAEGEPLLRLDAEEERFAVELARVRVQDAEQKLARYEQAAPSGGISATVVDEARNTLESARIELGQAELALAKRTLTAPFDGVTGIPAVESGDRINESTEIATLDDRSAILVDFEVPEAFAAGVSPGAAVHAESWALPGVEFTGTVTAIDSRITVASRTLRVRARIPNADDRLRSGMSFSIRLPLPGDRFPAVPSVAVQWDRQGAHIWLVRDGRAERVAVKVLKRSGPVVLIEGGLDPDELVVVEGVQSLRDGMPVEIVDPDAIAQAETVDER